MRYFRHSPISLLAASLVGLTACQPSTGAAPTAEPTAPPAPTATVTALEPTQPPTPEALVESYTNATFGVSIQYPADWFGPDINEYQNGFRFEVGTDIVYPYGTDLQERKYEREL